MEPSSLLELVGKPISTIIKVLKRLEIKHCTRTIILRLRQMELVKIATWEVAWRFKTT
jgi:hypothetical protein